jgi:hypothetical protein
MPAKFIKTDTGKVVRIKAFRLPNGNLVIPQRMERDRTKAEWVEVEPGSSLHKRWLPVAVDEPDPRDSAEYKAWRQRHG